ncbi:hypothetical protein [Duganella sp. Root1480D1]|uniref:hypothetical protein n=1 Tax=Duganella sp. Root1480D1 TaxID=1736471 RepID=UPI0007097435|nr:hypothetical protein [Duganella sp. Root1480D1]KQZ43136.1 hypothetical protein ASD58_22965 [Duganella sp. Root1480D1]
MRKSLKNQLEIGKCYFRLGYYDRNLTVPFMDSFFFIGRDLYLGTSGIWFFQSAEAFLNGQPINLEARPEDNGVIGLSEEELEDIVDWSGLIEEFVLNKKMQDEGKFLSQRVS